MIAAGLAVLAVGVGLAAYYVRLHVVWRREVARRRAERERQRDFFAQLERPAGNVDVTT